MSKDELIPHLFRTEYRKIVSVLARCCGFEQLETAEDIASETFLTAAQTWGLQGAPENPTAWLYSVARNKAKNFLRRTALLKNKILGEISSGSHFDETDIDLSPENITDSQLQMMIAICHPSISPEAQIALSLKILCGFGVEEIADAFLTNKEIINKRLFRAKQKLREKKINFTVENADIDTRLVAVLRTIYLLFNEGYYSISQNKTMRKDLCLEAIRLCTMLVENELTNKPEVNALLALMCFHISRFDARVSKEGALILYEEQDVNLWNGEFISKGGFFLNRAAGGNKISKYHLEAGIAYWNTQKADSKEKWESMLALYDHLLQLEYSPVAALNRTYALAKAKSKSAALLEAEKLDLRDNHFYFALLAELYADIDDNKTAENLKNALRLAKTDTDRRAIQKRLDSLSTGLQRSPDTI
ncbi:MAG TPA: sigma-70 family RNA polymerase sigma factor [Chryseolinea sp.]